ncbi:multicopper oxidase [Colletotrichum navitas]|uniref:Multicopper oxidase n=1 Tax=Colletotrichum navitas TaxID=681940 RepID=A0AAD8PR53_9PEZI|nr:multicopper oxidase [Colletotrichum navitas]KAK1574178.1 multicopper oxidase [Colletotrichum navitas]
MRLELAVGVFQAAVFASFAQAQNSSFSDTHISRLPEEEVAALAQIVEDDPEDIFTLAKDWLSPEYALIYRVALPIPPVKEPTKKIISPVTGKEIWYYELEIKPFTQAVYPNLRPATLVGYDGMSPGPTLVIPRGTESVVRFINNAAAENSVHLHGSYSRAPFDGWAEDITNPGEYKDYYYPNQQSARLLWYHDHAMHIDEAEKALNLPSGYGVYDIPLILTSKQYNEDGTLFSTKGETNSLWGDVIHVNGQPWPFLNVEPRKYRFRFLDASVSRAFALYLVNSNAPNGKLPFQVIASDGGLLTKPVQVSDLYVSPAERYEIVIDFAQYAGQRLEIRNFPKAGGVGVEDDFLNTDKVMQFVVGTTATSPDTSTVPETLRSVPFPESAGNEIDHHFRFHRTNGEWRINGVGFADVENRILANVPRGSVQIWELENSSDGWSHPIHVHLVDFKVIARDGDRGVMPYEAEGLKDVVWLGRGESVLVEAHYAPWDGVYMFHCHNLIHEDSDMMAAFNVTVLPDFGYNETKFIDPMEARWRAKPYVMADLRTRAGPFSDTAIEEAVQLLANTEAYSKVEEVNQKLQEYWATH